MPIVIKDLLASDTLSQAVDKINFNFDQLILNGGGPVGPPGKPGPTGPVGGRGLSGATWYKDNVIAPGSDPNSIIIVEANQDDYFLQSDGQVWQYNGSVWIKTVISLLGPQGTSGTSFGFSYAGGFPGGGAINNQNFAYLVPMPDGIAGGANQFNNQGISAVVFGAVASNASQPSGITFDSSFKISNTMAGSLDSSVLTMLIHQKNSSSSAIRFMGGGEDSNDKYEQDTFTSLSNITIGIDDSFDINIPKLATAPTVASDFIGFNINTLRKGQRFRAGKQIMFVTGTDSIFSGVPSENSDVSFTINTSNQSLPAKFLVTTTETGSSSLFELGGNIIIPSTFNKTGTFLLDVGKCEIGAKDQIRLRTSDNHGLNITPSSVNLQGRTGQILINTITNYDIIINSGNSLNTSAINQEHISSNSYNTSSPQITLSGDSNHTIFIDNQSTTVGGIKLRGNLVWNGGSLTAPMVTSHRNISIIKSSTISQSPVYLGRLSGVAGQDLMIDIFKGTTQSSPTEYNRIYTASTDIKNEGGFAGFVGHTVENVSPDMELDKVGFKLIGIDHGSGNDNPEIKFHAKEDTTSIYNRMQYVRRDLDIDPLFAGINGSFVIPPEKMDATYLDIVITGLGGMPDQDLGVSDDSFNLVIPEGLYPGQRLIVHIIIQGAETSLAGSRVWPSLNSDGAVNVLVESGAQGNQTLPKEIVGLKVTRDSAGIFKGSEATFELLYVGTTYESISTTPTSGLTITKRTSGWIITNGVGIVDPESGIYKAREDVQSWI